MPIDAGGRVSAPTSREKRRARWLERRALLLDIYGVGSAAVDFLLDDRDRGPIEWSPDNTRSGQRARERWARRYDALNGAPESDSDR